MIFASLIQNWKLIALAVLIISLVVYRAVLVHQRDAARAQVAALTDAAAVLRADNASMAAAVTQQNRAVAALQAKMKLDQDAAAVRETDSANRASAALAQELAHSRAISNAPIPAGCQAAIDGETRKPRSSDDGKATPPAFPSTACRLRVIPAIFCTGHAARGQGAGLRTGLLRAARRRQSDAADRDAECGRRTRRHHARLCGQRRRSEGHGARAGFADRRLRGTGRGDGQRSRRRHGRGQRSRLSE